MQPARHREPRRCEPVGPEAPGRVEVDNDERVLLDELLERLDVARVLLLAELGRRHKIGCLAAAAAVRLVGIKRLCGGRAPLGGEGLGLAAAQAPAVPSHERRVVGAHVLTPSALHRLHASGLASATFEHDASHADSMYAELERHSPGSGLGFGFGLGLGLVRACERRGEALSHGPLATLGRGIGLGHVRER